MAPGKKKQQSKDIVPSKSSMENGLLLGAAISALIAAAPSLPMRTHSQRNYFTENLSLTTEIIRRLTKKSLLRPRNNSVTTIGTAIASMTAVALGLPPTLGASLSECMIKKSDILQMDVNGIRLNEKALEIKTQQTVDAIESAYRTLESFRQRQWMYTTKDGLEKPVSEIIGGVVSRVKLYAGVGSIMIQQDPHGAALVWGAFNFLLQVAGNDVELTTKVAEAMDDILVTSGRYRTYIDLYKDSWLKSGQEVYARLQELYKVIESFSDMAIQYYKKHTAERIVTSAVSSFSQDFGPTCAKIQSCAKKVEDAMLDAKRDEKRRNRLLDWLSRVEYEGYHTNACQRRHTATCEWILQRPEFIKWRNPRTSSILWIHGNPGTGKTVAMSKIIDDLKSEDSSDTPVTYFYCNFDEKQNKDHIGSVVLASILKQILSKRPSLTHSSSIHKEYKRQKNHSIKLRMGERPYKEVQSLLFSEVGKLAGLYILIDGLDELGSAGSASSTSSRPRSDILSTILELVAMRSSTVKVIVSSRVAVEISHHLESFPQICVDQACTQTDMEMYIRATIEESVGRGGRLKRPLENNPELADQIVQKLTVKADGMFLYVHLQVKTLPMESTSRAVKQSVERVPVGMDNMYQEIFERLANDTEASQVLAMRTLSWVSCAARPLSVKEFIEVTAINPRERRLDPELREHDEKAILDVCSNLLIVVKHENEPVFRFCHFSVQEFLKQRMNKKNSGEISVAAIDMKATHQEIFDYSMIYLLRKEFDRGPWDANTLYECQDQFNKFMGSNPFTSYAAVYWPRHLLKMSDSAKQETIPTAIAFLKDTQRCRLCFQIYWFLTFRNDYPKDTTAIHIAGFFGLTDISRILLRDASVEEVNAQDSLGRSGLHWAAMNGHAATMRVFLEAGATVNILDERRMNPMGLAAFMGQKKIVDELLEYEKDRLDKEQLGISLLLATEGGRVDIVETLLGAGTDPTLMVHEMTDPLFLAASSRNIEICKLLLDSGAPVDTRREYGNPLQGAAANGCVDAVKLFLAKGAEIDWIGGEGATAMTSASFTGQYECVKVLLEHGATIRLQNDVLGGALNLAESTMNQAITDLILQHARKNNVPETLLRPPTISKKDHANKPTSGVSLDAMKMAAKGFFRVIRVKQMEIARGMLKLGGQMIISGVECDDLDFIDRYYELIIFMTPQMLPHKNSEMIEMLFSFLNMFYDLAQKSNYKDKIVKDYRAALSTIMGILLNGGFQTMILGLMINREKEIIKLIEKEKFLETESHLSFWRELMLVGMAVPGHCFITRGSSYVYVAIIGRLNEMPLGKDLGFKLMERDRLAVSEKHLAGLSVREGGNELVKLVEMYNAAYTLRLDEVVGVLSATAKSIEGSMGDLNINTQIAARVSGVRRGCTVEEWKWDHDEVPWWEKSTN